VDIVLRVFRHTVIDDVRDARDVNATSGDIRCDEKFESAFSEALESFHALFLRDIRVHDGDLVFVAVAVEESEYLVCFTARSREDHEGMEVRVFEESQKELVTLFHGHRVESVADGFSDLLAGDGDRDRIVEAPFGEAREDFRHGCREEERLSAFPWTEIDDFADGGEEAHIHHAIDLIKDESFESAKAHGGTVEVVDEASRGSDDDICTLSEVLHLLAITDTSVEQSDFDISERSVLFERFSDLVG
jgi:hypothetical protein